MNRFAFGGRIQSRQKSDIAWASPETPKEKTTEGTEITEFIK
jgi:hypothetical protein